MQKPETIVRKKPKYGWNALSVIALPGIIEKDSASLPGEEPGKAQLEIETSKPAFGKGVKTQARVVYKTDYGFRTAISYGGTYAETGGDYGRAVQTDATARVTEKKVREFHESSLGYVQAILEDVALHYGKTVDELFEAPALETA